MTSVAFQHDVGAYLKAEIALNPEEVSTTDDGSERSGYAVDRQGLGSPCLSAKLVVPYAASLAAAETATVKVNLQDVTTTTGTWADYDDKDGSTANTATIGSTASTAAQTVNDVLEVDFDIGSAKRYLRVQVTPTLTASATETDTVDVAAVIVFGGADVNPAT
ncbi:hypothetical protein LCGC14_2020250 [marine sediment metagenome]|uniref:Uncharacterized protein n=1 Tax=marine sediment metagenome TaxID=412755 RepID=A0A0F9HUV5_9ZZZZ